MGNGDQDSRHHSQLTFSCENSEVPNIGGGRTPIILKSYSKQNFDNLGVEFWQTIKGLQRDFSNVLQELAEFLKRSYGLQQVLMALQMFTYKRKDISGLDHTYEGLWAPF